MIAHVNVFTQGIGHSHWTLDLGFTVLPKYRLKKIIAETMNSWFIKYKNVYAYTQRCSNDQKSWIIHISFT